MQFIEKQLRLIKSVTKDVAAVFCRSRVMSESGTVYLVRWQRSGRYSFDDMLVQSCPPRVGSSLLIKKAAFDQAGLFDVDIKSAQDLDMWLRIQRDSDMAYFYGSTEYLLDIRIRPGAISRDHSKRFKALDDLIAEYGPAMKREPLGMAYVRAAVFAYRAADDSFADRWAAGGKKSRSAQPAEGQLRPSGTSLECTTGRRSPLGARPYQHRPLVRRKSNWRCRRHGPLATPMNDYVDLVIWCLR